MSKWGYYLLKTVTWIVQMIPLRIHYITSDLLFLLVYYIIRYRRDVVSQNLANAFPEKTQKEREKIARKFYLHFCDSFIETLYFDRISEAEIKRRFKFKNPELVNNYLDQGRQVIGLCGHYNNWEWSSSWALYTKHRFYAVYKKLRDPNFDLFYYNLRSKFGCVPLEKSEAVRLLIKEAQDKKTSFSAFISDQTPKRYEIHYWTNFLNQDTPVLNGMEKIAQKLDAVLIFSHTKKIKRGYYELEYSLITEHAKGTATFEITEKFTRILEQHIIEEPAYWLWSHKRWKHKREVTAV
jgi:Kdo2-lipid IVA lauroyltransferase/acyltransferase